jgi:hypothetical protein
MLKFFTGNNEPKEFSEKVVFIFERLKFLGTLEKRENVLISLSRIGDSK